VKQKPEMESSLVSFRDSVVYVAAAGRVHEAMIVPWTRFRFGSRYPGAYGGVAFVVLEFIAVSKHDLIVHRYAWLTLAMIACRRVGVFLRWRKGDHEHSECYGYPWISMKIGFGRYAMWAEPFSVAAIGYMLRFLSPTLGMVWIYGGFTLFYLEVLRYMIRSNRERMQKDKDIEMREQARGR
jgi:hypothetical protein